MASERIRRNEVSKSNDIDKTIRRNTGAAVLLLFSMCVWKICSLLGEDTVFMFLSTSVLSSAGIFILSRNIHMLLVNHEAGDMAASRCRLIMLLYIIWTMVLIGILVKGFDVSSDKNIYDNILNFKKVTIINYSYLSIGYALNSIITVIVPLWLSALLLKGLPGLRGEKNATLLSASKTMLIKYTISMITCIIITIAFLITGEHASTPIINIILNMLFFMTILYFMWQLIAYFNEIIKHVSAADRGTSEIGGKLPDGKKHYLLQAVIATTVVVCSIMIITGYSPENDFTYAESRKYPGTIEIDGYIGERSHMIIPARIDGKAVTAISFDYSEGEFVQTVKVAEGIKQIGNYCFYQWRNLKSVSLPESVEMIGYNAFNGCYQLEKVNIPPKVTAINWQAFAGCSGLTELTLPDGLTFIDQMAFYGCTSLERIEIPRGVDCIYPKTFEYCRSLKEVILPEGVRILKEECFKDCYSLTGIELPDSLLQMAGYIFYGCKNLTKIIVPADMEQINEFALETGNPSTQIIDK